MFDLNDFKIFEDPTLNGRLDKVRKIIDPKFEIIGREIISNNLNDYKYYLHIAKHLRRHKNPPPDTWLAISKNNRGYKGIPHFELGIWPDSIFENVSFLAEISERDKIVENLKSILTYDNELLISNDHTSSKMQKLNEESFNNSVQRYLNVKKADLVIGYSYRRDQILYENNYDLILKNSHTLFDILNKF